MGNNNDENTIFFFLIYIAPFLTTKVTLQFKHLQGREVTGWCDETAFSGVCPGSDGGREGGVVTLGALATGSRRADRGQRTEDEVC